MEPACRGESGNRLSKSQGTTILELSAAGRNKREIARTLGPPARACASRSLP